MDKFAKFVGYAVMILIVIGTLRYITKQWTADDEIVKRDRCEEIETAKRVENLIPTIIEKSGNFGTDVQNKISSCEYYNASDSSLLLVSIYWKGPITGAFYRMDGQLTLYPDTWEWKTAGGNDNLKDWTALKVISGAVADASRQGKLHFTNNCDSTVRMALSFKDTDNRWRTLGWWNFQPKEEGFLRYEDQDLITGSDFWYSYAESTDEKNLVWKGETKFNLGGIDLPMFKTTDSSSDKSWSIICD